MDNKTLNTIGTAMQIGAGLLLVSSFFVKDNSHAVNRRWLSVGLFAAGLGVQVVASKKLVKV